MAILCLALQLYGFVLIARILLSWVPRPPEPLLPIARFLRAATDPILEPLRRVIPPVQIGAGAIDFSPIVAFIGLRLLQGVVC